MAFDPYYNPHDNKKRGNEHMDNMLGAEGADKVGHNWGQTQGMLMQHAANNLADAESGETSIAQRQLKAGLGQAQRGMAAQAAGRGANPLAQRAAMYSGGQMAQQANTQAAALRAQEMQAAQQQYMAALNQQAQGHMGYSQMGIQRDIAYDQAMLDWSQQKLNEEERERQFGMQMADMFMNVAAMGAMSDETAKRIAATPVTVPQRRVQHEDVPEKGGDGGGMLGGILGGLSDEKVKRVEANHRAQLESISRQLDQSDASANLSGEPAANPHRRGLRPSPLLDTFQAASNLQASERQLQEIGQVDPELASRIASMQGAKRQLRDQERVRGLPTELGVEPRVSPGQAALRRPSVQWDRSGDKSSRASRMMSQGAAFGTGERVFGDQGGERQASAAELAQRLDREADDTARKLQVYQYEYKPELQSQGAPGGLRGGIMAQDLGSTSLGHTVVKETPHGKALDIPQATGLSLGLIGRQARRADEQEARIAELERMLGTQEPAPRPEYGGGLGAAYGGKGGN